MKSEILALLRESGEYISGQELCRRFGVSRTAVWKVINQLKKEGYQIEAVQNKGYRLTEIPDILSGSELESRFRTKWAGRAVHYFEVTDSTNIQAKRLAEEEKAPHGTLVVAEEQTAGRGRRGRDWESPSGGNLYFTLLLRPELAPNKASMLTLVMAMAVARGIENISHLPVEIKWPNDIVQNGKKIVGILTEMSAELDFIHHVVIGVGINVARRTFPAELREKATTLEEEMERKVPRALLLEKIMEFWEEYYEQFIEKGNLSGLQEEYNSLLVNRNRQVRVLDPREEFSGMAQGINAEGELLVALPDGSICQVSAGEVSVRGIYGYV